MADVNNMKLFSFDTKRDVLEEGLWAAVGSFQEWFIKQTSHLEALRLLQSKPRLALCAGKLHHLKHLEMEAHAFVRETPQAGHLPSLETLYLHVCNYVEEEINILGLYNLRRLVMRGMHVQPVLCEPKCQLGTHLHAFVYNWPREVFEPRASLRQTLQATTELGIGPGGCLLFD